MKKLYNLAVILISALALQCAVAEKPKMKQSETQFLLETIIFDVAVPNRTRKPPVPSESLFGNALKTDAHALWITNFFPATSVRRLDGGFTYLARINKDLDAITASLADEPSVRILQKPRIQTSNAVPASIFIGRTIPYVGGTSFNSGGPHCSAPHDLGVGINLTPVLNPDGSLTLNIRQSWDRLVGSAKIVGVGEVHETESNETQAPAIVQDHETLAIGGWITSRFWERSISRSYPANTSRAAAAFDSVLGRKPRVEILLLVRPTVLRGSVGYNDINTPKVAASHL
jgi:hypothetical protein